MSVLKENGYGQKEHVMVLPFDMLTNGVLVEQ